MSMNSELQKRLAALEDEQNRQEKAVKELTTEIVPAQEKTKKAEPRIGFIIRLDFGSGAPISEWSDETHGWRSQGLGTRYGEEKSAELKLTELKNKWPDYPLKIFFAGA